MTCQKTNLPLFAATLLLGLSASIHAEGTWSFSSWTSGFTPAQGNLIRNVLPSSYSGLSNSEGGKNVAFLTDGAALPGDMGCTQCLGNNAVLTWTFDSPVSIREVKVYCSKVIETDPIAFVHGLEGCKIRSISPGIRNFKQTVMLLFSFPVY